MERHFELIPKVRIIEHLLQYAIFVFRFFISQSLETRRLEMFLLHILYWFFVGLLIYSVVVIPVFTVATSAFVSEGYVCDLLLDGKVSGRYILNYGLVFSTSITQFSEVD